MCRLDRAALFRYYRGLVVCWGSRILMKETEQKIKPVPLKKAGLFSRSGLRFMLQGMRRKHVPPLLQMTEVECGLTCLAMVLSYHGRKTSVSELRARFGGGRDGFSALG